MCGIAGVLSWNGVSEESCCKMVSSLHHRGPDSSGVWVSEDKTVAIGHTRLAILDLSPGGHQPMPSPSGRYLITFNGEVYNYKSLASELSGLGYRFRSSSDTEVIVAAIEAWGVTKAVKSLNGMFAFAVWDKQDRKLTLVRDRVGIKPLYYGWSNSRLIFASELHAFKALSGWENEVNRNALLMYMRYGYVPAPYSIHQNVYKLVQGSVLTIAESDWRRPPENFSPLPDNTDKSPNTYWSVHDCFMNGKESPFDGSFADAVQQSEDLLLKSIERRLVSDVPLGSFLSGGIDSSTIVTLMQSLSSSPIDTFTVGVEGHVYDESSEALSLSKRLDTNHTQCVIRNKDALDFIPNITNLCDEPFADSSLIPTYLLSKITKKYVSVCLSGDGGDEVFGGYNRYIHSLKLLRRLAPLPKILRRMLGNGLLHGPWPLYGFLLKILSPVLPSAVNGRWLEITIPKIADLLLANNQADFYDRVTLLWPTDSLVLGAEQSSSLLATVDESKFADGSHYMRCCDLLTYHVDDILTKVDRASMAVSLEARVPFVDHTIIEFVSKLPEHFLTDGQHGKLILREILRKRLPSSFQFGTNKKGFSVPLAEWLRGPLRDWAESLLDSKKLQDQGFLNVKEVKRTWREHLSGNREWAYRIWNILIFQSWLETHQ